MSSTTSSLFIGGCKDGQWIPVKGTPLVIHIRDYTCFDSIQVEYRLVLLTDGAKEYPVYVEQDVLEADLMLRLLKGYKP